MALSGLVTMGNPWLYTEELPVQKEILRLKEEVCIGAALILKALSLPEGVPKKLNGAG